jgi:hypothetical protein
MYGCFSADAIIWSGGHIRTCWTPSTNKSTFSKDLGTSQNGGGDEIVRKDNSSLASFQRNANPQGI